MKPVAIFFGFLSIILFGCGKEQSVIPYTETVLYREGFNEFGAWELQPNQWGFTADSCVRIDNGILKLTYESGVSSCGGTWVGIIIRDSTSFQPDLMDNVGIRIRLNRGHFNRIVRYRDSVYPNGSPSRYSVSTPLTSWLFLSYNKFDLSLPGVSDHMYVHEDSAIDLSANRIDGSYFEVIHNKGEWSFFVDGVEHSMEKVGLGANSGISQPLRLEVRLGHQPELNPQLDELFIDDIEIYTWCGDMPK
jgi:hypothetical protein